jgi:hypothetical protein
MENVPSAAFGTPTKLHFTSVVTLEILTSYSPMRGVYFLCSFSLLVTGDFPDIFNDSSVNSLRLDDGWSVGEWILAST